MRVNKTLNSIKFVKVKDTLYNTTIDSDELNNFIKDIIESFTVYKIDKFSPLMDLAISEEILARIVADAFLKEHEDEVRKATTGVIINCPMRELNYKVTIGFNEDKLGGIIYGVIT